LPTKKRRAIVKITIKKEKTMLKEDSPLIIMLEECSAEARARKILNTDIPLAICRDCPNSEWFVESSYLFSRCKSSQQISYATARDENEKSVCVEDCDTYLALFKEKHGFNLSLDVREQRDDLLKEKQKKINEYNAGKKMIYKQERAEAIRKEIKAKYIRRDADGNFEGFKTKVHNGPLDWVKLESEEEVKEQFAFIDKQVKLAIGLLG